MNLSDEYCAFAGHEEGRGPNVTPAGLYQPYLAPEGQLTVGQGHVILSSEAHLYLGDMTIPQAITLYKMNKPEFLHKAAALTNKQVLDLFRRDMLVHTNEVIHRVIEWGLVDRRGNWKIDQHQFDCLVDLAFNDGPHSLDQTIHDRLVAGDYTGAGFWQAMFTNAYCLEKKKKGPMTGLTFRRYALVWYWFTGELKIIHNWDEARTFENNIRNLMKAKGKTSPLPFRCNRPENQIA